jgi:transposase
LTDHREDLVAERTRVICRLRWHLHQLDPSFDPPPRSLTSKRNITAVTALLEPMDGLVAQIAASQAARIAELTAQITTLDKDISTRVRALAPALLALPGVAELTAAKIVGQTADVDRFKSAAACARHNGTAPLPVWSGNRVRHRLSRTGNRQLNCAIHRIAVTQKRCHPDAQAYLQGQTGTGHTDAEALRALKRKISDAVYRRLKSDAEGKPQPSARAA